MVLTFLKKLGTAIATGLEVASGIGPIIAPFIGQKAAALVQAGINDFTALGQIILQAEVFLQGEGTGPEKLARALPLVVAIVKNSELISGKHIADDTTFTAGCGDLITGLVKILNSLKPDVSTSGNPVVVPPATS